ncbi:MAG: hypothetical protein QUS11_08420 [Candidatus Fermentibacter sp.]|nr:hypothetical protein [Candidatus Fermentibacter sp.]
MERADWTGEFPGSVVVTDAGGTILYMNGRAAETFASEGGSALVGRDVREVHPPAARVKVDRLFETKRLNAYTIEKNGVRKLVYQSPWFSGGEFAGFVELSLPIPADMPHFVRGTKAGGTS